MEMINWVLNKILLYLVLEALMRQIRHVSKGYEISNSEYFMKQ